MLKKIETKHALKLWRDEQSPTLVEFKNWLKKRKYDIPPEGERWNPKWVVGLTEEVVRNPDYHGLVCGRIELWNDGDYPALEYQVCLPSEMWYKLEEILEEE